jgi:hypothetical protein
MASKYTSERMASRMRITFGDEEATGRLSHRAFPTRQIPDKKKIFLSQ